MNTPLIPPGNDLGEVNCTLYYDEDSVIWLSLQPTGMPDLLFPLPATKMEPELEEFIFTFVQMVRGVIRLAAGRSPNLPKHMKAMEEDLPAFQRFLLSEFSWGPSIQGRN